MRSLRFMFFGYFFFLSEIFLVVPLEDILSGAHMREASLPHLNLLMLIARDLILSIVGVFFLEASWFAWRERATGIEKGRGWMIAASLVSLSLTIGIPILYVQAQGAGALWEAERVFGVPTMIGGIGVALFARKRGQDSAKDPGAEEPTAPRTAAS